MGTDNI